MIFLIFFIILESMETFDIISTEYGLKHGFKEGNPLLNGKKLKIGEFIKIIIPIILYFFSFLQEFFIYIFIGFLIAIILMIFPCINNIYNIWRD